MKTSVVVCVAALLPSACVETSSVKMPDDIYTVSAWPDRLSVTPSLAWSSKAAFEAVQERKLGITPPNVAGDRAAAQQHLDTKGPKGCKLGPAKVVLYRQVEMPLICRTNPKN